MHDYKETRLPDILKSLFSYSRLEHEHFTRNSENNTLHIPLVNSSHNGLMSLRFKGASLWNTFLNTQPLTANISSHKLFVSRVKSYLIDQYMQDIS